MRCVAVVLLLLLVGCTAPLSESPPPAPVSGSQARDLLLDSWMTDGERGFFVEGAGSTRTPPFSLYQTLWRLQLAGPGGISADRMRPWVGTALDGALPETGLPALAQADAGVQILRLIEAPVDADRVAATLARLRSGDAYRPAAGQAATPLSTAMAVRLLNRIGRPVPAEVLAAVHKALASPAEISVTVALLQAVAPIHDARLAELVRSTDSKLAGVTPDVVWLALRSSLRELDVRLDPVAPETCASLVGPDGGVAVPGQDAADPQATSHAVRLGCRGARVPAALPHSRAGWPTPAAAAGAVAASSSGVRVAAALGDVNRYIDPIVRQIRTRWLPAVRPGSPEGLLDVVNLKLLAGAVGGALPGEVAAALPAAPVTSAADDVTALLHLLDLSGSPASAREVTERVGPVRPQDASILHAARLAFAADLMGQPENGTLREIARSEAASLRRAPGVYAVRDKGPVVLTASALGLWIERPSLDALGAWTTAGLCAANRCVESPQQLGQADHLPLRALATVLDCRAHACSGRFPALFP